mmetsp:Transcript_30006/g.92795  ORF Transcript_30006/g.92795 Transcript_30006/m.92795 type:complete len:217 (+) Transcript_30006:284-934(+)
MAWNRRIDSNAGSSDAAHAARAFSTSRTTYARRSAAVAGAHAPSILRMPSFFRVRQRAAASHAAGVSTKTGAVLPLAKPPPALPLPRFAFFLGLAAASSDGATRAMTLSRSKHAPSASASASIAAFCAWYMTSAGDTVARRAVAAVCARYGPASRRRVGRRPGPAGRSATVTVASRAARDIAYEVRMSTYGAGWDSACGTVVRVEHRVSQRRASET